MLDLGSAQGAESVLVALLAKPGRIEKAQRVHCPDLCGWVESRAGALLAGHAVTFRQGACAGGAGHSRSGRSGALGGGGSLQFKKVRK